MFNPELNNAESTSQYITTFGGLNHNFVSNNGEWYDEYNLSTDSYPFLKTRKERYVLEADELEGKTIKNVIVVNIKVDSEIVEAYAVLDGDGYINFFDESLSFIKAIDVGDTETIIAQAGYIYTFPSNKRVKCFDLDADAESLDAENVFTIPTGSAETVTLYPCNENGNDYTDNLVARRGSDVNPPSRSSSHPKNHFDLYTDNSLFARHINVRYDTYFAVKDGVVKVRRYAGGVFPKDENGNTLNVSNYDFVCCGHGNGASWIMENIRVGYRCIRETAHPSWIDVYNGDPTTRSDTRPTNAVNGLRWYDTKNNQVFVYSGATEQWTAVTLNYIRIDSSINGMFDNIRENDVVKIDGLGEEYDAYYFVEKTILDGSQENGQPISLILSGYIDDKYEFNITEGNTFSITRKVPEMEYVTECNNRLWGCHYGINENGEVINEIYASALGDAFNWRKYQGTSADSYTATIGIDGKWTGAITYGGYPVFFKEDCIIRVYGSAPSSYQTNESHYRGVKDGSSKSLCIVDEVLYYHSSDGILAYTGGIPSKVDTALGNIVYYNAVCGGANHKLYVSMSDLDKYTLFVYDTRYGIWHKEDYREVVSFFRKNENIFMVSNNAVLMPNETVKFKDKWWCETTPIGINDPYKKRLKSVKIRVNLPYGSEISVYSNYDGGEWELDASASGNGENSYDIYFVTKPCDKYKIKICGKGECTIESIYYEVEYGGE